MLDNYVKQLSIEADTMIKMLKREIIPGVIAYKGSIAKWIKDSTAILKNDCDSLEKDLLLSLDKLTSNIYNELKKLDEVLSIIRNKDESELLDKAIMCKDVLLPQMNELRAYVDKCEELVAKEYWKIPDYCDLLYSVKY